MSYFDEMNTDITKILALAEEGEIEFQIRSLMQEAWMFGWTTGFAFQGKANDMVEEVKARRRMVDVPLPEGEPHAD